MELTLAPNPLHPEPQTLNLDQIATLIGENGSGKSCILYSVFDAKLKKDDFEDLRIVCFSSGQNENFSQRFSKYLTTERRIGRSLNLDCFYYDKSWSKLLIFLATCLYSAGRVRQFLRDSGYVDEEQLSEGRSEDISSKVSVKFKVDGKYAKRVQSALQDEESGETETLRATPYFRSLTSFIETNIDPDYDFAKALRKKTVTLTASTLFAASYSSARPVQDDDETENATAPRLTDNPTVSFFTQAADNDYFLDKSNIKLTLKGDLELDQLSDGEYQLLFLYALIDLFDSSETLFLLDEADSHLHYQNIDRLWKVLASIQGKVVTTTHLLDSITANEFTSLKVVKNGKISEKDKLKQLINRLHVLSRAKSVEFEVCAKIENMALLDDYNDWDIFLRLAKRKGLDITRLQSIYAFKKASSYATTAESFGKTKIQWTENLSHVECTLATAQVFLICDCDEASLSFDPNSGVKVCGPQYRDQIQNISWPHGHIVNVHLLAWKRREIKNYLLSFSALSHHNVLNEINNDTLAAADHLKNNAPCDNDGIRSLNVKTTVNPFINREGYGLCPEKLQSYIDLIPPEEISEDIENMYSFIVSKL